MKTLTNKRQNTGSYSRTLLKVVGVSIMASGLHLTSRMRGEFYAVPRSGTIEIYSQPLFLYLFGGALLLAVLMFLIAVFRRQLFEAMLWLTIPLAFDAFHRMAFNRFLPSSVFVVLVALLCLVMFFSEKVKFYPSSILLLLLAIAVLICGIIVEAKISIYLIQYWSFALLIFAISNIIRSREQLYDLFFSFSVTTAIATLPDFIIMFTTPGFLVRSGRLSFLLEGGVNTFGAITALVAIVVLILGKIKWSKICTVLFIYLSFATLLSGSRYQLAVLAMSVMAIGLLQKKYWIAFAILGVGIFVWWSEQSVYSVSRIFYGEDTLSTRYEGYSLGLEYLSLRADRVLWGIGPANWRALSESYFGKFTIIHNPVIDIFVENGIFSTILFTLFFAYMGIMALRMYQRGGETSWVGIMVLTALLVTFNTGLFSYTPFFILGLGEAYYRIVASAKYVLPQGNPQQQEIINATL